MVCRPKNRLASEVRVSRDEDCLNHNSCRAGSKVKLFKSGKGEGEGKGQETEKR